MDLDEDSGFFMCGNLMLIKHIDLRISNSFIQLMTCKHSKDHHNHSNKEELERRKETAQDGSVK
ncbi:hypothetical protein AB4K20DRAFT_1903846 [Rhizopus microsporus]